ncbi:hypothetical protein WG902_20305 [Ramlibacter sp. PS3R-8]|uniref:hypothetical protein n=1 Tax=Ramlibacter sp. PS3R-8 TaxID=3133437 RepID=UPI0030ACF183
MTANVAARRLFIACGVWLVGLGMYFIFLRPPLLPEDPRFMGATLEQIRASLPGLAGWLDLVFTVMGGFMAASGVLTLALAMHLGRLRQRPALVAMILAGATSVGTMSAVNFVLHSDFRWLLLVPAVLWLMALALMVRGIAR